MNDTIIYCTRSAHVFISSSDEIYIRWLSVNECGVSQEKDLLAPLATLAIYNCSGVVLSDSLFVCQYYQCGVVLANAVKENLLINIMSNHLLIIHNMTRNYSFVVILNYNHMGHYSHKHRAIEILFYEHYHLVKVYIDQIKLSLDKAINILCSTSKGANLVRL